MAKLKNKIQLISYPDSLGGDLRSLHLVLKKYFKKAVEGVHILPFYPYSSDRGFSPLTHFEVKEEFGGWSDVENICREYDTTVDLMINHISSESSYFQDFLHYGEDSEYKNWFIDEKKFFKSGRENKKDVEKMYRVQPDSPFREFRFFDGEKRKILCTFSVDQVDLDVSEKQVKNMFRKTIANFAKRGVKMVRLDAVGYAVKKQGTSCFMLPETYKFIDWVAQEIKKQGMEVLPEIHYRYELQFALAERKTIDWVYDFSLSLLVLQAIYTGKTKNLAHWLKIRPHNQITTLDNHDGLGVIDVNGLISEEESDWLAYKMKKNGGNSTMRATGLSSNNVDIYQINVTYYSALRCNDKKYLLARAVQFFTPGIPQVYYVGLLAGKNDTKKLKETGVGRDILRHNYSLAEIEKQVKKPVVKKLLRLMKFRNGYPAFDGRFSLKKIGETGLVISWEKKKYYCRLEVDFKKTKAEIKYFDEKKQKEVKYRVA